MNTAALPHRLRTAILSAALAAAALGLASTAFAGEETTWYDKWPDIQAQLADRPAEAPRVAQYAAPVRTREGGLVESPSPPLLGRGMSLAGPPAASPYDGLRFNWNPG